MIRSLLTALALACAALVPLRALAAAEPAPTKDAEPPKDTSIDRYRTPAEALTERMIGTASRAIRFDWRHSKIGFGVVGSELLERNNFGSARVGAFVRKPFGSFLGEVAITRAFTWATDSSDKLALTPYRQFGRPSRFELDVNVAYPIAEGVMTSMPGFIPPAELVFAADAGFRYLFYPGTFGRAKLKDIASSLVSPQLTQREINFLEPSRTPGMAIDKARYSLMAGLSLDVYFQPGAVITPRALIAVPILSPVNGTGLGLWWELSMSVGWAL